MVMMRQRKFHLEPRFPTDSRKAQLDTLRHFVVSKRTVSSMRLGRCDGCDGDGTITDGYMVICVRCDALLAEELKKDEASLKA